MTIEVRSISIEDVAGYHQAFDSVAKERRYLLRLEAPPLSQMDAWVRAGIEQDVAQFVAADDQQVIGWCHIQPHPRPGLAHCGELGMGLVAGYRRRGLGYRLMEATVDKALAGGLTRIELEVFASNLAAIALYEKFGFVHEGVKRKARYMDGQWDDMVLMALLHDSLTEA